MDPVLNRAIQQLPRLTVEVLRAKYRDVFGEEAKSTHKQFLIRRIAWQLQARAEGDLSERARMRAAGIVEEADLRLDLPRNSVTTSDLSVTAQRTERDSRLPRPGTLIRRDYQGRGIVVKVLEQGFEYETKRYRSLSAIAREVTGTRWNGLLFFGLVERRDG